MDVSERFISPEPLPTLYERELLTILMEECAEVTQRASKALRFGLNETQPGQPYTNVRRLSEEIGDLIGIIQVLQKADLALPTVALAEMARVKQEKISRYLQSDPLDARGQDHER